MRPAGCILIVDDDPLFLATYRDLLSDEGYTVETATSREAALARMDERDDWDVVILDQKLLGREGPDQGIDLIEEVSARAPRAKAIIATAYASKESIERAFDAGVYDFLEKSGAFTHLLRAKVRNALEAVRERDFGRMGDRESEERITSTWKALETEADANRKGLLLEELVALVFRSIEGFHAVSTRRRSEDEEIDIVIRNESTDPTWARESPYILVECKNWSRPVRPQELTHFQAKLERRFGRARLGFFVAPGGFTKGFHNFRRDGRGRNDGILVVCIGPEELAELVASTDRNATLKQLHDRSIVEANGSH